MCRGTGSAIELAGGLHQQLIPSLVRVATATWQRPVAPCSLSGPRPPQRCVGGIVTALRATRAAPPQNRNASGCFHPYRSTRRQPWPEANVEGLPDRTCRVPYARPDLVQEETGRFSQGHAKYFHPIRRAQECLAVQLRLLCEFAQPVDQATMEERVNRWICCLGWIASR
jgi:hypothetical protein